MKIKKIKNVHENTKKQNYVNGDDFLQSYKKTIEHIASHITDRTLTDH